VIKRTPVQSAPFVVEQHQKQMKSDNGNKTALQAPCQANDHDGNESTDLHDLVDDDVMSQCLSIADDNLYPRELKISKGTLLALVAGQKTGAFGVNHCILTPIQPHYKVKGQKIKHFIGIFGVAEHVGDTIYCADIRSVLDPDRRNQRLSPIGWGMAFNYTSGRSEHLPHSSETFSGRSEHPPHSSENFIETSLDDGNPNVKRRMGTNDPEGLIG